MTQEQFDDWYNKLIILTYGELSDEDVLDAFKTILQWKADGVFISDEIPESKYTVTEYWLYLSLLYDCVEYGTSPRGGWLTDLGKKILDFLNNRR